MQDSEHFFTKSGNLRPFLADAWVDKTACISDDMDYFIKNISIIKGKDVVRPGLIGSIITHYAIKWIPELAGGGDDEVGMQEESSPETVTAIWTRKKFFIESLVQILPPERDSIPCNFLLKLLRVANMVRVDPVCCAEVERRVSCQLDQASLKELMIPCFSHTATTLLDVKLVLRLVKMFVGVEDVSKNGVAVVKVAKLIDSYLAEAAVDSCLTPIEFIELACVMPPYARAIDDGLYRAIDTYLKAHPGLSKQDRKTLCKLIDSRKLSPDASLHASENERLPVRAVIKLLLSEQAKLNNNNNKYLDWSRSLGGTHSPAFGLDLPSRCLSKRETTSSALEIKRLKEDVQRLQSQCMAMEKKMEKLLEKKRLATKTTSYFSWKKFGIVRVFRRRSSGNKFGENDEERVRNTPVETKAKLVRGKSTTASRRRSSS